MSRVELVAAEKNCGGLHLMNVIFRKTLSRNAVISPVKAVLEPVSHRLRIFAV
jgi:hypothetical protein